MLGGRSSGPGAAVNALRRIGVDWKDRRLIWNLYVGQKVSIRIEGECSEPGVIGREVR